MKGRKIFALVCGLAILGQNMQGYAAEIYAAETASSTAVTLDADFISAVSVSDKVYDGTPDAAADLSGVVLNGAAEGDEVYLTCRALFDSAGAGVNKEVTVSELKLAGKDSGKYDLVLTEEQKTFTVNASITPMILDIVPQGSFAVGEKLPKKIDYTFPTDSVLEGDTVEPNAVLTINMNEDGSYFYQLDNAGATGSPNYAFALDASLLPVPVAPDPAQIYSARVVKKKATELSQFDFGVVANESVQVVVRAKLQNDMPVTFTVLGEEKTDTELEHSENPSVYIAEAVFDIELPDGDVSRTLDEISCVLKNGDQENTWALPLIIDGKTQTTRKLILDNAESALSVSAFNDGENHCFSAGGTISDADSGIKEYRFKWDDDIDNDEVNKWKTVADFDHKPGAQVNIDPNLNRVEWKDSIDTTNIREGKHIFNLEIIDNAGVKTVKNITTNGSDTQAPEVKSISLGRTTSSAWSDILTAKNYGTFVKEPLKLTFTAEDCSESELDMSGIRTVEITDGSNVIDTLEAVGGVYTYTTPADKTIDSWSIRLCDNKGNSNVCPIKELLAAEAQKADADDEAAAPEIDWSKLSSNKWVFDSTAPSIAKNTGDGLVSGGIVYYNMDGGKLRFDVSDAGSLGSVRVYRAFEDVSGSSITNKLITAGEEQITSKTYGDGIVNSDSFEFDTAGLKTGKYVYRLESSDCAGNAAAAVSVVIYVDHARPDGSISVASPEVIKNKKEDGTTESWISEKDGSSYVSVKFNIDMTAKGSPVTGVKVNISGRDGRNRDFSISSDSFISEDGRTYAVVSLPTDPSAQGYIPYDRDHTYRLNATVNALSGNVSDDIPFTLHIDSEAPAISSFTVKRKNPASGKILNVLSFGVFSNDSVILTVRANDAAGDIGMKGVKISYTDENGKAVTADMEKEGSETYTYELSIKPDVFKSEVTAVACDRMGKTSTFTPNIEDGSNGATDGNHFVMLEQKAPSVTAELPASDSSKRSDGQIWYRSHRGEDTEKFIELTVKDADSGIDRINMSINGVMIDHDARGNKNEKCLSGIERDGNELLSSRTSREIGAKNREDLCKSFVYRYSVDSIAEKIPANSDGSYVIEIEAFDNAGNAAKTPVDEDKEPYQDSKVVFYRDDTPPEVEEFEFGIASYDDISSVGRNDFVQVLDYGYYFKESFDVVLVASDAAPSSGLDSAVFRLVSYEDGEIKGETVSKPVPVVNGRASYTIPKGFKGQIYGKVSDKVSNVSDECTPKGYVIDDTAPTVTIEPLPENAAGKDADGNNIYTGAVSFRVTVSDRQSGLRSIAYSKSSEIDSSDAESASFPEDAGRLGSDSISGWEITGRDENLVTEVSRVFTFDKDDNAISLSFTAVDRSGNECEPAKSAPFTIDTVAPRIEITNSTEPINGSFYSGSAKFTIKVTERNFSDELIRRTVTNGFTSSVPTIKFSDSEGGRVHTAEVLFPEGDYTFSLSGSDLAGNRAVISYNGGEPAESFSRTFSVDATNPRVQTNFSSFGKEDNEGIYFSKDQTAEIIVTEHNFFDKDMGIRVQSRPAGASHAAAGAWTDIGYRAEWKHEGDKHTLVITFDRDGVYRITMDPKDAVGNKGNFVAGSAGKTPVYEIDKTAPVLYARNDKLATDKDFVKTPFCDVYDEKRKDEKAPSVEFEDVNFDRIEVKSVVYTPAYKNGRELGDIEMSPLANELSKPVKESKFTLSGFENDGVYSLDYVAVDKAGNKSETISDTYFRMIDTDVLAYICNSSIGNDDNISSGYYSLMNTEGKAISKKATDFDNLDIAVIKPVSDTKAGRLVLREDEKIYSPEEYNAFRTEKTSVSETAEIVRMHLPGEYFSESFRDDGLNTRMYLSVSIRDDVYLDIASIHIDNEAPTAVLPEDFKNWHNYFFEDKQAIVISGISEVLDDNMSKVYECPRKGKRFEISHEYDPAEGTLTFVLDKGVHHIDVTLVDEAGNELSIDRVKYIRVGNFRLYLIGGILAGITALAVFFIIRRKRRV